MDMPLLELSTVDPATIKIPLEDEIHAFIAILKRPDGTISYVKPEQDSQLTVPQRRHDRC